jgi:hypothetical protein
MILDGMKSCLVRYTKEDILKFCFDIFDTDGSGCLDEKEVTRPLPSPFVLPSLPRAVGRVSRRVAIRRASTESRR